jgi:hypothetical protein
MDEEKSAAERIILALHKMAQDADAYELGLPVYDEYWGPKMVDAVNEVLAERGRKQQRP